MKDEEYIVDDRVIIPEDIKKMSREELEQEILKLEQEERKRKTKKQKLAAG